MCRARPATGSTDQVSAFRCWVSRLRGVVRFGGGRLPTVASSTLLPPLFVSPVPRDGDCSTMCKRGRTRPGECSTPPSRPHCGSTTGDGAISRSGSCSGCGCSGSDGGSSRRTPPATRCRGAPCGFPASRLARLFAAALAVVVAAAAVTPTPVGAKCASRLWTHPEEYARCRNGTMCFFFLPERSIITVAPGFDTPDNPLNPRVLFPCKEYRQRGLSGLGWTLHSTLFPNNEDWCALAGTEAECTFNDLIQLFADAAVDGEHPASGMGLAASGAWVSTEWRAPRATASDPIIEDQVVLVRRTTAPGFQPSYKVHLRNLHRPFSPATWMLIGLAVAAWVLVTMILAVFGPTPVWHQRSTGLCCLQCCSNCIGILLGGEPRDGERHFAPTRALLLCTFLALMTVFVLFYEAAFILGAIGTGLVSPVSGLSDEEMCRWIVLRGAATEDIFVGMVNSGRTDVATHASTNRRTWSTCETVEECISKVTTGAAVTSPSCAASSSRRSEVYLSWRTTILAAFRADPSLCDKLEVVDAEEELFFFSVGWQFANVNASAAGGAANVAAYAARRAAINGRFRRARLERTTETIVEREIGRGLPCASARQQVTVGLLLLPVLVILLVGVIGSMLATVVVPILMRALEPKEAHEPEREEMLVDRPMAAGQGERDVRLALPPAPDGGNHRDL